MPGSNKSHEERIGRIEFDLGEIHLGKVQMKMQIAGMDFKLEQLLDFIGQTQAKEASSEKMSPGREIREEEIQSGHFSRDQCKVSKPGEATTPEEEEEELLKWVNEHGRIDFPVFISGDLKPWLFRADQYLERTRGTRDWDTSFSKVLRMRFGFETTSDINEMLTKIRQVGSLWLYLKEFEKLSNLVIKSGDGVV
ncbi:hypothetical protein ACLOJK_029414 [Asimina triloba]